MTGWCTCDGVTLAYDEAGTGDPSMLFIHGMAGNRSLFPAQLRHFGSTRRVVAYDQRGHGDSDRPLDGPYDIATLAEDARQLIDRLGLDRPVVVGHSLGGTVAMALAAAHPDHLRALVVLDSAFELSPEGMATLADFYDSLTEETYQEIVGSFVRDNLVDAGDDPSLVGPAEQLMASLPLPVFVALGRGRLAFDSAAVAADIVAPTLYVGASRPFADLANVHRCRPDWYLGKVVGSGHKLQLVVPDQVNAMIDRFLGQLDAGHPTESQDRAF